jgi:hypothetical protein
MDGILIDATLVRLWIDASKEETRLTDDLFRGSRKKEARRQRPGKKEILRRTPRSSE